MKLYGQSYTRREVEAQIGDMSQLGGVSEYRCCQGKMDGMRVVRVKTADGLEIVLLPDRCLDIASLAYRGTSLGFASSAGMVHPAYYDGSGTGSLRSFFGGFLATCGLTNAGVPSEGVGLHGRIGNTPAEQLCLRSDWVGDDCILEVSGTMREAALFGEKLLLKRSIRASLDESEFTLCDEIINFGFEASEFMLMYHMNYGFPLLRSGTRVITYPPKQITPADEASRCAQDWMTCFEAPTPGIGELGYTVAVGSGENGETSFAIVNDSLELGVQVSYSSEALPYATCWKLPKSGDYVLGYEPCVCPSMGRERVRAMGLMPSIAPGESYKTRLQIRILHSQDMIRAYEYKIKS